MCFGFRSRADLRSEMCMIVIPNTLQYVQAMSSWAPPSVILMAWIEDGALEMVFGGKFGSQ